MLTNKCRATNSNGSADKNTLCLQDIWVFQAIISFPDQCLHWAGSYSGGETICSHFNNRIYPRGHNFTSV